MTDAGLSAQAGSRLSGGPGDAAAAGAIGHAWHALPVEEVVRLLDTDGVKGLAPEEARRRLSRVGENRVGEHPETPAWRLLLAQFESLVVLLLLSAAGIAWLLGERLESLAILAALVLNAGIGFATEWRARRSLSRLRALSVPVALVRRGGRTLRIPAAELVPGDLVVLEAGAHVPADLRLVQSSRLRITEAALTGESTAVDKSAEASLPGDTPLVERRTMTFLGTTAVAGTGLGVVTATGVATELGRIGQLVALAGDRSTPLERQVEGLGRRLMGLALAICGIVGLAGILHGEPIGLMLETAISLAIAAIPESLPAVTTVALAAGLWRLARAGALVRRLPAVETLGSTTVICADKTGTMTENRMTVTRVFLNGRARAFPAQERKAGSGPSDGAARDALLPANVDADLARLLSVGALVNDATSTREPAGVVLHGDPTETALLAAALAAGLDLEGLAARWPRRREIPFDPATRLMTTFHETPDGGQALLVKGAPGAVLDASTHQQAGDGRAPLSPSDRERLLEANRALAGDGLRVLALAWRPEGWPPEDRIDGLTFLGFVGLEDPIREGVDTAIARCREAGIRTIMLTGDQQATAEAVGRALGLPPEAIRSRVSPEGKLALIQDLQRGKHERRGPSRPEIVAMTGDGVNDAPALARADIGVAMGRQGTDVARDVADLVLTDDNFSTIVRGVEEGRVIYANLRKVIRFLFTCNLSEILTIFVAIVLGFPSPLLPLQILWVNLVTDILPALALVRDPAEPDVMRQLPRDPEEALVTWGAARRMLAEGTLLAAGVLSAYFIVLWQAGPGPRATTVAFVALVLIHPFQAMSCRSDRMGWWRLPPNRLLWAALLVLVAAQWAAVSWAPLAGLLRTVPLAGADWLMVTGAVLWPVLLMETLKGAAVDAAAAGSGGGTRRCG